jgi:hypothetical protein
MPERLNWRHPDYLRTATKCDVCKRAWSDEFRLNWVGHTSSVVCTRADCEKTMNGWLEDTWRHVEEQFAADDR